MPKIAEVKLSSCWLEVADFRKNCDCGIAELQLRSNISLKSCGSASFKLRNCDSRLKKKLCVPISGSNSTNQGKHCEYKKNWWIISCHCLLNENMHYRSKMFLIAFKSKLFHKSLIMRLALISKPGFWRLALLPWPLSLCSHFLS
jgi:hypothetical protein